MITNCDYFNPVNYATSTLYASSTCETIGAASTTSGFTNGEIVNSVFICFMLTIIIIGFIFRK